MSEHNPKSSIDAALRQFEAAEANIEKLERIFREARKLVPDGIVFGRNAKHEELCRAFDDILEVLPLIDGWKPQQSLVDLDSLAQQRLDAQDIDEFSAIVEAEETVDAPINEIADYRYRLNKKRRQLIRTALSDVLADIDSLMHSLCGRSSKAGHAFRELSKDERQRLRRHTREIDMLLGRSVARPAEWEELVGSMESAVPADFSAIMVQQWPKAKAALTSNLYLENEPIPIEVEDLGALAAVPPRGSILTKLKWNKLSEEHFERLLFELISGAKGYENPGWLMKTKAPDRGRDLSVTRVVIDPLGGVIRSRVIIQCRRWTNKSVSIDDVAKLKEQMKQWEPPRVDVLVIATTGRFTSDAVSLIESNNGSDRALRIEMWPESHLERLLAERPALIAEYGLL